jgi:hypothetical protein
MKTLTILGLAAVLTLGATAQASAQRPLGDRDRDGVPNVIDPRNDNRRDSDRDGIPNRVDQRNDNGPYGDRDHDGRANAYDNDRWDGRWGREVRAPKHWGNRGGWNRHVRACFDRYRTYNPRTDTYVVRRGVTARCRL